MLPLRFSRCLPDILVKALLSHHGQALHHDVELGDGVRLALSFDPRPTAADSLVVPRH